MPFIARRAGSDELFTMSRASQGTVEGLLSAIGETSSARRTFDLWVPQQLTLRGQPAPPDIAMAVVLDKILSMGYEPDGFIEAEGGRTYRFKMMA